MAVSLAPSWVIRKRASSPCPTTSNPTLSELFAAPVTTTQPNFLDPFRNVNVLAIQNTIGNPNLTPEIARNTSVGAVLANPKWLPGFSLSVDYYTIKIKDVIGTLCVNDIVQGCFNKTLPTCDAFNLNNQGRATDVQTRVGSTEGEPLTYNLPRNVRVGVRYMF